LNIVRPDRSYDKKSVKEQQKEAKEYAKLIDGFLRDDIFPRVLEAIKKEKDGTADFEKICDDLNIKGEQKKILTATAFGLNPEHYKLDKLGTAQTTNQLW